VADQHLAEQLSEVGAILLMFGVGLQFHLDELLAVREIAVPGALVQSTVATLLGAGVAHWYGWPWSSGLVFGIALSVASTVVLVRVLADNRDLHTPTGHIAVGWLVVEDIFTVLVLVLMPALAQSSGSGGDIALTLVAAILKIGALVAFTIVAGSRIIRWILRQIALTKSRGLFTLAVLALALGIAVASALLFGGSMALGAFLAGMVVGRSEFSVRAASDALPMRDAFAVLFFVSVGMLLEPAHVLREPGFILLTLAVILIGKPIAALAITYLFRQPLTVSASIAVVLSQIGEFSFIVATLGMSLGAAAAGSHADPGCGRNCVHHVKPDSLQGRKMTLSTGRSTTTYDSIRSSDCTGWPGARAGAYVHRRGLWTDRAHGRAAPQGEQDRRFHSRNEPGDDRTAAPRGRERCSS
jgi:CPA2 family monovalent cation:H+ antiporter-2